MCNWGKKFDSLPKEIIEKLADEDSTEIPFVEKGRLVLSMVKRPVHNNEGSEGSRYTITYGDYLQESVSLELRANPEVWKSLMNLWSKLAKQAKYIEKMKECFFHSSHFIDRL